MESGYPPPCQLRGLDSGERGKLPQRDLGPLWGRALAEKRILVHSELEKNKSGDDEYNIFLSF